MICCRGGLLVIVIAELFFFYQIIMVGVAIAIRLSPHHLLVDGLVFLN